MPGTILVTVLELMELQLPSASTSSSPGEANKVLVKVSHGKREYRTASHSAEGNKRNVVWESSDFSFPLFNLRDSLSISVLDCDENEIGRTDIKIHSIIEKGMWDDMFPLEGGGLVHLKLQFLLTDAERQRIQTMEPAALKKKEEGPLKESVPEICVEKVPSVEYQTLLRSAPGLMLSPQKSTSESPYLQSDQSMSSTPPLSFDIKNYEDSVLGYLSKHEEPYLEKSQLSKPEITPKGNLRKVKEMIQAFESSTTMEPKREKLSRADMKFDMSEPDSDAQYSWKVEGGIRDSCTIQKNSGALYNVDVQKRYITDKGSKFRTETGNNDTRLVMAKVLRNGKEEDFLQNFVEMENGDGKTNHEAGEEERAKLTRTFSFIEAPLMQNPNKEQSSFPRSKSVREFKSSQVNAQVSVTGGHSPEKMLPSDASLEEEVPLCLIATHYAESTEVSNQASLPAKTLETESLVHVKPQLTISKSRSYVNSLPQSTDLCDVKSVGAKVPQNGEEIHQFAVDETGQIANLDLHSYRWINSQKTESVGSLSRYWFSSNYQESPAMHRQIENRIFESLTDYITCGEMSYLCLTAGDEQVKNLVEIYMTSEKCTSLKKSGRTEAAEKGFLDTNSKDSCCQKKSGLDNLMGAIDLMDGFLKQV
ncbi:unnamed protein product [Victoria cruziana]